MNTITVREGSQAQLFFPLTDGTGQGADLAGKRVELILADKDANPEETIVISNIEQSRYGSLSVGARNQTQILSASGTSGTFKLRYGQGVTAALNYNATAAAVQSALEALSGIGAGNVVCSGGPLPTTPITIEFVGNLFNTAQPLLIPQDVSTDLTVTVTGQTIVYYTPATRTFWADLSPYKLYFRVIDATGTVTTYPEDGDYFIRIDVHPGYLLR